MGSQDGIKVMEEIIVENAGPMGKFVIKKSISDLGIDPASITGADKDRLVNMVLERAVFDKARWEPIRKQIISRWSGE